MITIFILAISITALTLLILLSLIDLKTMLLPNKYVASFCLCGIAFHYITDLYFETLQSIAIGTVCGGGLLLLVRAIANRAYKKDTLGMGDIKLMAAAGLWLGAEDIFLAITLGAIAGLLHGVGYGLYIMKKTGEPVNFMYLCIPAGPGFIVGIIAVAAYKFQSLPQFLELL